MPLKYCVAAGSWYAVAANALIFAILASTVRWWGSGMMSRAWAGSPLPRWFWPCVLAAAAACAALTAPRLGNSFWDDEEYALRRAIAGTFSPASDEVVRFKPVGWNATLFFYEKPTNHILSSVLSRAGNSVWAAVTHPKELPYSEAAVRFPSFLAGLGAVVAAGWLCGVLGMPGAGALAAWLLALHPWFCRHVPEARAYPMFLALIPVVLAFGVINSRGGGVRVWLAFAAAQFLMVAAWSAAAVYLAVFNACLLGLIFSGRAPVFPQAARLVAAGLLASGGGALLYFPCVPQFFRYSALLDDIKIHPGWFADVGARLLTGLPWATLADHPSGRYFFDRLPAFAWAMLGLGFFAVAAGFARMVLRSRESAWVAAALAIPAPLFAAIAVLKGAYLFQWYMLGALPAAVIFAACGIAWPLAKIRDRRIAACLGGLACAVYFVFGAPSFGVLFRQPVAQIRESVLFTRPSLDPNSEANRKILTAAFLSPPLVYDPRAIKLDGAEDLRSLVDRARRDGLPLYINQGYTEISLERFPGVKEILLDPELFERVRFPGIEPMFDRDVFRLKE